MHFKTTAFTKQISLPVSCRYTLGLLVLTVPVSTTEDVKALYEAAPKRVLEVRPLHAIVLRQLHLVEKLGS